MIDKMFQEEIDNVKLRQENCISFYINDIYSRLCCNKKHTTCCLPLHYVAPGPCTYGGKMLKRIMGVELHIDDDIDDDLGEESIV